MGQKNWIVLFVFILSVLGYIFNSMTRKEDVIIAFTIDDNYAPFVSVTIESIKEHANPKRNYKVFILGTDISDLHLKAIYSLKSYNIDIQVIEIKDMISKSNIPSLKTLAHINTVAYHRFFIPEILQNYRKTVYLEADQILQEDIANLYDIDLKGKSLGVAPQMKFSGNSAIDHQKYCKEILKMKDPNYYFNAGVLVMNLEKLRKSNFRKQAISIAKDHNLRYIDQDILNLMFSEDCVYIPEEWNVEVFILEEIHKKVEPKLIHFTTWNKPWKTSKPDHPSSLYSDLFWKYARKVSNYQEILKYAK